MNKNNSKKKTRMKKFGVLLTLIFLCSIVIYAKEPISDLFSWQGIGQKAAKAAVKESKTKNEENIEKIIENVLNSETENKSETESSSDKKSESETEAQTDQEKESETETQTDQEKESESETQSGSEEESESETQSGSEEESESEQQSDSEEESEAETQSGSEEESETETILEENIPFNVILLIQNGKARTPGQAQVDTFGQIEILGARTSYKHNKATFQTIYCLNYVRNGAYGIYGSDRTSPVHPSITYVLAKGMKMAKNNETMDAAYRGNDDLESYYITQMALHLVNGAIGGEEDISGLLDQSKNPAVYQKIYALYQDAMDQKEPVTDPEGYTKEVTCEIIPEIQTVWIKDETKGGFRTKENYKVEISDPSRVIQSELSLKYGRIQGVSITETGKNSFYLHASESAFEQMKAEKDWKAEILSARTGTGKNGLSLCSFIRRMAWYHRISGFDFFGRRTAACFLTAKGISRIKSNSRGKRTDCSHKKGQRDKKRIKGSCLWNL